MRFGRILWADVGALLGGFGGLLVVSVAIRVLTPFLLTSLLGLMHGEKDCLRFQIQQ